ncbi:cilia- and flagella-associated protein 410 isoform X2 [Onthophagus taurus]|uniref:cilia- and flagella-associated protein 410 isoform X2 n=1 Tax=Onthophagus taurus TaxID=166361 RepID=UPI000C206AE7|nr:protein C21orf2 homolog isoform X2 [Onthophagus taurus]
MAKRLTEEMVIARTKISDLGKIKRLNCWGSELVDVTLLRRMPCVEVLSLSINRINTLEDFQFCKRLEELYIRQNNIRDLNQVCYLQALTNLKNLWLGENPCANTDGYRLAVLRALPQLQKFDNVTVTPEELKEAQRKGKVLSHPEDPEPSEDEEVYAPPPPLQIARESTPPSQYNRYQEYSEPQEQQRQEFSPQRSPSRQDLSRKPEVSVRRNYSPEQEYVDRRRNSYERESPPQYYDRSPQSNNSHPEDQISGEGFRESRIVTSHSTNSIKQEYTNGDRYVQQQCYRHTETEACYGQDNPPQRNRERHPHSSAVQHRPPFTRRPVTRNSNILSAVLCLVKELDYPSLEVVEVAVRCRMDELDE